jgi:hypothetical protein
MFRKIPIDSIVPGMFIESISPEDDNLALHNGNLVTSFQDIQSLKNQGIDEVGVNLIKSKVNLTTLFTPVFETYFMKPFDGFDELQIGSLIKLKNHQLGVLMSVDKSREYKMSILVCYDLVLQSSIPAKTLTVYEPSEVIEKLVPPTQFDDELLEYLCGLGV